MRFRKTRQEIKKKMQHASPQSVSRTLLPKNVLHPLGGEGDPPIQPVKPVRKLP
jgi:hypothetical protein